MRVASARCGNSGTDNVVMLQCGNVASWPAGFGVAWICGTLIKRKSQQFTERCALVRALLASKLIWTVAQVDDR